MTGRRVKILIVGAGPAGVSAAYHLSKSEKDILILDRLSESQHCRYHSACGEAVSRRMLSLAGIQTEHAVCRVDSIEICYEDDMKTCVPADGFIVDRPKMINEILLRSGVSLIRTAVRSVRKTDGGYEAETPGGKIFCEILIGADGAHSVVRRDIFGTRPEKSLPIMNTVIPGSQENVLRFFLTESCPQGYAWRFPSSEGKVSFGFPAGTCEVPENSVHGGRHIPIGRIPSAVSGKCILVGDAAALANPFSYGGIGVAMVSGRKAAELIISGKTESYDRWIERNRMFDRRFMKAREEFFTWDQETIKDAMKPLIGKATLARGFYAILRRPSYRRMYLACWFGFRYGWRSRDLRGRCKYTP